MDLLRIWKSTSLFKQTLVYILSTYIALGVPFYQVWAADIFVDAAAAGGGNGSSWADAYTTVGAGLGHGGIAPGDVVRVKSGDYTVAAPLTVPEGVTLRSDNGAGGFDMAGTTLTSGLNIFPIIQFDPAGVTGSTVVEGLTLDQTNLTQYVIEMLPASGTTISPTIRNNTITSLGKGIQLGTSFGSDTASVVSPVITGNIISSSDNSISMYVAGVISPTIDGNTITSPKSGIFSGVNLSSFSGSLLFSPIIRNNSITGAGVGSVGVNLSFYAFSGTHTFAPEITDNLIP